MPRGSRAAPSQQGPRKREHDDSASSTTFEAHHVLHDRLTGFRDLPLLTRIRSAQSSQSFFDFAFVSPGTFTETENIDLVFALFAGGHRRIVALLSGLSRGAEPSAAWEFSIGWARSFSLSNINSIARLGRGRREARQSQRRRNGRAAQGRAQRRHRRSCCGKTARQACRRAQRRRPTNG